MISVRRLARYMINSLTVLSLVLCVATVALWVRSFVTEDCWDRNRFVTAHPDSAVDQQMAWVHGGRISIGTHHTFDGDPEGLAVCVSKLRSRPMSSVWHTSMSPHSEASWEWGGVTNPASVWAKAGFERRSTHLRVKAGRNRVFILEQSGITLPCWFLSTGFALPAATKITVRSFRGRRRRGPGRCVTCDYDLRATPDRCPECGTVMGTR